MNRMEFGLARVKVANKDFTYYYVPAFVVYGSTYFYTVLVRVSVNPFYCNVVT